MKLELSAADETFRQEVRAFLREHLPPDLSARAYHGFTPPLKEDLQRWNRILFEQGWAAPHWPVQYGGTGWTALQQHIFEEECHLAFAPDVSWQGLRLLGPVLYSFGSESLKKQHIPGILTGDVMWAQGFSEPNAGSDLVSLKTRAVREGDHYIVNGQKIWSSEGHYADWGFFLVRTDPDVKPQKGISFLLIDLRSPGITVRPIIMINGAHYVNEIFLENVKVPVSNLVGQEGQGWTYTKFLLEHERTSSAFIYFSKRELQRAKQIAQLERRNERAADRSARVRTPDRSHRDGSACIGMVGAADAGEREDRPRSTGDCLRAQDPRLRAATAGDGAADRSAGCTRAA